MNFEELLASLVPAPREARPRPGSWRGPAGGDLKSSVAITLDERHAEEGYSLEVDAEGARLAVGGPAGQRHGLATLAQWCALARDAGHARVPGLHVVDAPSFAERGVMLDVARDRRPTLATLRELATRLARLKINRLQLYMEADFAYSFGAEATADRSPYTPAELRELDAHCAQVGIELVPNQQSFGHLHAWLRHERWKGLAEVPGGVEHPFSRGREPFSLAPELPESAAFLARLYDELLPCFSSNTVNVGLDETFDLGLGRSAAACEARGKHAVYLEFLERVHDLLLERGKRMQFWGDILLAHPEDCARLAPDVVALDWGYEADHPFDEELAAFTRAQREVQVVPGTSSWNGFVGRTANLLENLHRAARAGARQGATGMLVTDWGDRGHLQPGPVSAPGLVLGAALAWNAQSEVDASRLARWLDQVWFEDEARVLGRATLELGRLQEVMGDSCKNGNAAFFLAIEPDLSWNHERLGGTTREGLEAAHAHLERAASDLARARSRRADAALLVRELEHARQLARFGVEVGLAREAARGAPLSELEQAAREPLAEALRAALETHAELWPQRSRPGGFEASRAWLATALGPLEHASDSSPPRH